MTFASFIYKDKKIDNKTENGLPFVIIFHPKLQIVQKITNKSLYLLYMNKEVKNAFTPEPSISYRSFPKPSSYLGRVNLYPINRIAGCHKSLFNDL